MPSESERDIDSSKKVNIEQRQSYEEWGWRIICLEQKQKCWMWLINCGHTKTEYNLNRSDSHPPLIQSINTDWERSWWPTAGGSRGAASVWETTLSSDFLVQHSETRRHSTMTKPGKHLSWDLEQHHHHLLEWDCSQLCRTVSSTWSVTIIQSWDQASDTQSSTLVTLQQ